MEYSSGFTLNTAKHKLLIEGALLHSPAYSADTFCSSFRRERGGWAWAGGPALPLLRAVRGLISSCSVMVVLQRGCAIYEQRLFHWNVDIIAHAYWTSNCLGWGGTMPDVMLHNGLPGGKCCGFISLSPGYCRKSFPCLVMETVQVNFAQHLHKHL